MKYFFNNTYKVVFISLLLLFSSFCARVNRKHVIFYNKSYKEVNFRNDSFFIALCISAHNNCPTVGVGNFVAIENGVVLYSKPTKSETSLLAEPVLIQVKENQKNALFIFDNGYKLKLYNNKRELIKILNKSSKLDAKLVSKIFYVSLVNVFETDSEIKPLHLTVNTKGVTIALKHPYLFFYDFFEADTFYLVNDTLLMRNQLKQKNH